MSKACLIDNTKCIGCRSCQVSCKQWNGLKAEKTRILGNVHGLQNPQVLSAKTYTMVSCNEIEDSKAPGGLKLIFSKRQCMHCNDPACASACPATALRKSPDGGVSYDSAKCIGCRYCVWACPFGVPTAEWDSLAPKIRKCTFCSDRTVNNEEPPRELNGKPISPEASARFLESQKSPACVKACLTEALQFGDRDSLIAEAWKRIKTSPGKYVPHVYGEKEAGGTSILYLSSVPFEKIGFRMDLGERSYPSYSKVALQAVPVAVVVVGGVLAGAHWLWSRKAEVSKTDHHG
jgi:formate dehydrogenase iron-sulfur subunit